MILSFISFWYVYLIAILISVGLTLFFQFALPKIFPIFIKNIKSVQAVELVINPITGLYSLLLALVVVTLWQHFFRVQELVSKEASSIVLATHVRSTYTKAKNSKQLTKAIEHYIHFLPNKILPKIPYHDNSLELQSSYELLNSLASLKPTSQSELTLYSRLETEIIQSIDAKRERLSMHNKLPGPMLTILFGGGITLLFFLCIVSKEKNKIYFTLGNISIAVLIGFYLALIIDLNTTNSGHIGYLNLSSSPYIEEIVKQLQM
jgi:hypothetical protein